MPQDMKTDNNLTPDKGRQGHKDYLYQEVGEHR